MGIKILANKLFLPVHVGSLTTRFLHAGFDCSEEKAENGPGELGKAERL